MVSKQLSKFGGIYRTIWNVKFYMDLSSLLFKWRHNPTITPYYFQLGRPGALGRSGGLWAVTLREGSQSRRFGQVALLRLETNLSLNLIPLIPSIFNSSLQCQ